LYGKERVYGLHELRLLHVIILAMHELLGQLQVGLTFPGVVAAAIVKETLDRIHGDGLDLDQTVRVALRLLKLGKFHLGEPLLLHQLLQRKRLAISPRFDAVNGNEIQVNPLIIDRPRRVPVSNVQHRPVLFLIPRITGHDISAGQPRQVIRALTKFIREQIGLVTSFLGGGDFVLIHQHPLRDSANHQDKRKMLPAANSVLLPSLPLVFII